MQTLEPKAGDLHWIQIEDFVDIFNRVYTVHDTSWESGTALKRYLSSWIPGDEIAGSGGPPAIESISPTDALTMDEDADGISGKSSVVQQKGGISFVDNPMYPFSVSAATDLHVCLYQPDQRWAVGRVDEDPRDVSVAKYLSREDRLSACMRYSRGIGFVVLRLEGLSKRAKSFDLRLFEGTSEGIQFYNLSSAVVKLIPGSYVLIPFTDKRYHTPVEYVLVCRYRTGSLDFELDDILDQTSIKAQNKKEKDRKRSEARAAMKMETPGQLLKQLSELDTRPGTAVSDTHSTATEVESKVSTPPSMPSPSRRITGPSTLTAGRNMSTGAVVKVPQNVTLPEWEWQERSEEVGIASVFDQVTVPRVRLL